MRGGHRQRALAGAFVVFSASAAQAASWKAQGAGTLVNTRMLHTATLLPGGKVLIAGGQISGSITAGAEYHDPLTGSWSVAPSMVAARYQHSAVLLQNGKVLVIPGSDGSVALASAELFDPSTGVWSATGPLSQARFQHHTTVLQDGRVLVIGG